MSMDDTPDNPAATRGHNEAPRAAQAVTERMAKDYAALADGVTELLTQARAMPEAVTNEESLGMVGVVIKGMRDAIGRSQAFHKKEKEPYLRGGQAVDAFFFGLNERLEKASKILHKRADEYQQRKLAEARRKREEEERAARQAAAEAEERRIKAEREAAEAAAAAERARKPENIEAHTERSTEHAAEAEAARVDGMIADARVYDARVAVAQKPADMVRSRFDEGGVTATMRAAPHVEITDTALLDLEILRPFIKDEELLRALKAWAKTTGHKKPMAGAIIEMRDGTVIR